MLNRERDQNHLFHMSDNMSCETTLYIVSSNNIVLSTAIALGKSSVGQKVKRSKDFISLYIIKIHRWYVIRHSITIKYNNNSDVPCRHMGDIVTDHEYIWIGGLVTDYVDI